MPRLDLPPRTHVVVDRRPFEVRCTHEDDPQWLRYERELEEQGVPIPLEHRCAWARSITPPHCLVSAHDLKGRCLAAFAIELTRTRAAPGHLIARAERVGPSADIVALRAALDGWARMFSVLPWLLRMEVGLSSFDAGVLAELGAQLARDDFTRLPEPRSYARTSLIDLRPSEDELFARLHPTARRHIRAATKKPVTLEPIRGTERRDAMQALLVETRRRTHGPLPGHSLDEILAVAEAQPDLIHVVGLSSRDDGRLLAFAIGHYDGDHVTYGEAASTRDGAYHFPLGYAPLWDLVLWAKRRGATTFDLGGITPGSHADADDELGGISDFKRYFRGEERFVGQEWIAEPHALRAAIASRISHLAEWARGTFSRSMSS